MVASRDGGDWRGEWWPAVGDGGSGRSGMGGGVGVRLHLGRGWWPIEKVDMEAGTAKMETDLPLTVQAATPPLLAGQSMRLRRDGGADGMVGRRSRMVVANRGWVGVGSKTSLRF
ncbi:hypothetical protein H5410_046666 [Solanum commersonii]|uniref:Uncharacterized protein n=1 Tax=Solanum commersonii TaxID=4109 RepID=A0A9J5XH30_SOLCO|nr:hypothetical protein H5410_046666 [Solanum commersonii]